MYKRTEYQLITKRLNEPRKFIQVVMGARQIGKSTVVKQVLKNLDIPYQFFSADNVPATNSAWISDCWAAVRSLKESRGWENVILVIDEIQKIANWSEAVKKEWDDDTFHDRGIKVLLLGSSRVLLEKGLSESLAGRFEEIRMSHWSYHEMRECFGFSLDQYLFYGGYPGAATLIGDEDRFSQYIQSA
ncbi:MAG: AAA family ATPase, partial [Bacteroidetes bacterium]|nr:AAA family ATPase [Candidatus Enterocola intestinipullorum]